MSVNFNSTATYDVDGVIKAQMHSILYKAFENAKSSIVSDSFQCIVDSRVPLRDIFEEAIKKISEKCISFFASPANGLTRSEGDEFAMIYGVIVGDTNYPFMSNAGIEAQNTRSVSELRIDFHASPEVIGSLVSHVQKRILEFMNDEKRVVVNWQYLTNNGIQSNIMTMNKDWTVVKEAYPWVGTPLDEYYKSYVNSSSSILVCYGEPGTGKTTFIRDLLCETQMNAIVTYDEKTLSSDDLFTFFMTSPAYNALVIEDADDMLTSNRGESNKLLAKLLNASDGMIKVPLKKIILSTNLENLSKIDSAITRPGRCHDILKFRKLSPTEQTTFTKAAGIDKSIGNTDTPLSELFKTNEYKQSQRKLGFF